MMDERHMPLRLRPGEPLNEYLRRVHAAERDRAFGDPFTIPPKLYRASEVARHFDLTRQTVHNYATIGLIRERGRTPGGQRLFDESVFRRLHRIRRLKRRYRLHEIRRLLEAEDDALPAGHADRAAHDEARPAPTATEAHASGPDRAGATALSDTARDRREPGPTTATEDAPPHDA
ncbi:MAG: MerR family DNA-binding transcriptional regulator [Phycisphaerae bacterium]